MMPNNIHRTVIISNGERQDICSASVSACNLVATALSIHVSLIGSLNVTDNDDITIDNSIIHIHVSCTSNIILRISNRKCNEKETGDCNHT